MVYSEHAEKVANVMHATTYSVSGALLTFAANLVFQWLNHRATARK